MALTPAGEAFLAEARAVLDRFERAESVGRRAGRGEIGRIEVGYVGSAVYAGVLQDQIARFRNSHPKVDIVARELPMLDLPAMLDAGSLDVGFVRLPMDLPSGLRQHVLAEDEFCVALPAGRTEASLVGAVRAVQLRSELFLVPEQTSGTEEVARRGKFSPRVTGSPGSLAAVLTQVSLGHGVAVVPCVVAEAIRIPGVAFRALAGELVASEIAAVFRAGEASGVVAAFLSQIEGSARLRLRFSDTSWASTRRAEWPVQRSCSLGSAGALVERSPDGFCHELHEDRDLRQLAAAAGPEQAQGAGSVLDVRQHHAQGAGRDLPGDGEAG